MANNVGCNAAGGSCQYDHSALMANRKDVPPTDPPVGGADMVLVGSPSAGNLAIWRWVSMQDGWGAQPHYTYVQADYDTIGSGGPDDTGGEEGDGGAKPPSFPSTGPVFTPLDLTAPNQNPFYKYNYPDYAPDTGADFQSRGLLTQNIGYGGADPYQPWSQDYGNEFIRRPGLGGDNLWNYQPPSVGDSPFYYDLSKGPGPKVGFAK